MRNAMGARRAILAVILAAAIGPAEAAERPWVAVGTSHFTVVSNAGEGAARDIAYQFEQVRSVVKSLWPWARIQTGRPFFVVVARDARDLRVLAPQYWQGPGFRPAAVYVSGVDRDYVALRTDVDRRDELTLNPYATAYEGFASVMINASFPRDAPLWFRFGLQELIGNTLVRQKDIHVGRIIPYHLQRLAQGPLMPLPRLLEATRESVNLRDESTRRLFDAQAWAFVHYLVFGEKQANLPRLNRLNALILTGQPAQAAVREAFGDLAALESGFRMYLTQRLYSYTQVNLDLDVSKEAFTVRTLAPAEAAALRAGFLAAMRRPVEARALLAEARTANESLPGVYEVEGLLLDAEGKRDEARAAFERAIALGSESYYTHYRRASLAWPSGEGDFAPIVRDLEAAARLSPDYAPAHAWLAHARIETGAVPAAIESARKAVALEPGESVNHRALARGLANGGQYAEAMESIQRAIMLADNDRERADAEELKSWIRSIAAEKK
jgi:tetratricopeptide (TPR) repeat protein